MKPVDSGGLGTSTDTPGPRPVIVVVGDESSSIRNIGDELQRRYGHDYRIVTVRSSRRALANLEHMREAGDRVAVVLAAQRMAEMSGAQLCERVQGLHPHAKRALLIAWADWAEETTAHAVRRAMALGHAESYVLKPWRRPDELFHRAISEFLQEWSGGDYSVPREVAVVAERRSSRGHELRTLLSRNGVPHVFYASDSAQGSRLLRATGRELTTEPVVVLLDGRALVDPSNADVARAFGVATELTDRREFDVVVVGAGPAGLAAGVYASSEGLRTLVVEREAAGGQAGSSAMIRNYLGFPRGITGADLARRAYQQAWTFGTEFLFMREAVGLRGDDGWHVLAVGGGAEARARCVILAMGVSYRRLAIPTLERLIGVGVFYGSSPSESPLFTDGRVFVVGGGNSAGQAAVHLSKYAAHVTMVVRGRSLAASMSRYLQDEIESRPNVDVLLRTQIVGGGGEDHLEYLTLRDVAAGTNATESADALFVLIGARPHTDWLPPEVVRDAYGFVMTEPLDDAREHPVTRRPFLFQTTLPGVFAVGDVRSESVKRVASAAGEGSVVIQQVHRYLAAEPWRPVAAPPS